MHTKVILPQQAEVLQYTGKAAAVRGGIRSGKSLIFANWLHDRLEMFPQAQHYVVGADLPQLKRGFLRTFTSMLDEYRIAYTYARTDGVVTLEHNGARLEPLSAQIAERIRSAEMDTCLLEEPQTWENGEEVFQVVMGRLSGSPNGKQYRPEMQPQMRMSFNPPAVGSWLWDLIEKRHAMPCWQFSVRQNYLMPDYEEYIRFQESILPPERWSVELDGNWATFGGNVYRGYNSAINGRPTSELPPLALDPQRPLLWCLDFNIGNMASVICQQVEQQTQIVGYEQPHPGQPPEPIVKPMIEGWQKNIFLVLDEIALVDQVVGEAVAEFIARYGAWCTKHHVPVYLYGDSTGGNRNQQTIWSNWEVVINGLLDAGIEVEQRIPRNGPEWDRVNALNAQFRIVRDGVHEFGMLVNEGKCPQLVADFLNVKAVEGKNQIDKQSDPKRTHWSDALGYCILTERRLAAREPVDFPNYLER
jgi:hypothetical protein